MSADVLLSRLAGVRKTGAGRWLARCPAHTDKRASLSIRETEDQRILLHDFGGCRVHDVLAALSLEFGDLYPEPVTAHGKRERRPFVAMDVLKCITSEATIVMVAARDLQRGIALSDVDHKRLIVAATRIHDALRIAHGR